MRLKTTGRLPALKTAALFLFISATLHAQDEPPTPWSRIVTSQILNA